MPHKGPFKTSQKPAYDANGPNHSALLRSLEWLQAHDRDTPSARISAEIPRAQIPRAQVLRSSVEIPMQTAEEYAPPEAPVTEPPAETQAATTQTAEAQSLQPEPEAPQTERIGPELTETELADVEEGKIEAAETRAAQSTPRGDLLDARRFPKHYPADPADPARHERLCSICHHPDREAIEEAFLQWRRPGDIRYEFKLPSRTTIYRHAHAVGLFEQRARALRYVLENIMEESSSCEPSADSIIRAVRAYSCLDDRGRWIEPPRRLIISREPFPAPPLPPGREITVEPSGTTDT
jgi:hypothetical protein